MAGVVERHEFRGESASRQVLVICLCLVYFFVLVLQRGKYPYHNVQYCSSDLESRYSIRSATWKAEKVYIPRSVVTHPIFRHHCHHLECGSAGGRFGHGDRWPVLRSKCGMHPPLLHQ